MGVLLLQKTCGVGDCKTVIIVDGKPIEVNIPCPVPSASPISDPEPVPTVEPSLPPEPSPTPEISPVPTPEPTPKPSPSPGIPSYCIIGPDGNFGEAPIDECPQCWIDYARLNNRPIIDSWGLAYGARRDCRKKPGSIDCGCGVVENVHQTPHSKKPYLAHRSQGTETHKGCQPKGSDVPQIIVYPPNAPAGKCDPFSSDPYWCHHKPQDGQCGMTKFEVQGGKSISRSIP